MLHRNAGDEARQTKSDSTVYQQIELTPSGDRTATIRDYENQPHGMLLPTGARITYTYDADLRHIEEEG